MTDIELFQMQWAELWKVWRSAGVDNPLSELPERITSQEKAVKLLAVKLLTLDGGTEEDELFTVARAVRNAVAGSKLVMRASIDISSICRMNCGYCSMRLEGDRKAAPYKRLSVNEIVAAAEEAFFWGFRELFLQSGEDWPMLWTVAEAVSSIKERLPNTRVILNLGSLSFRDYAILRWAGGDGYVIKVETSDRVLHRNCRGELLDLRMQHTLWAREAGFEIGSGIMLGLPGQTDEHLANDIIHLGRLGAKKMVSCSPFTADDSLAEGFRNKSGDFGKARRFIALLRLCFPEARIPATSNTRMLVGLDGPRSGQSMMIDAGANGISVKFTPPEMEEVYSIYKPALVRKKYIVHMDEARQVSQETGLPLDLWNRAA